MQPFFKKVEPLKISISVADAERLEELAARKGMSTEDMAHELLIKALDRMELEIYSQIHKGN
jgi:hypothetical protein